MKFVNILPTAHINDRELWMSDTHLFLSHLIGDNEYTKKIKQLRNATKILDNGFFELQKTPTIDELIDKAKEIRANYIILPDTFYDSHDALDYYKLLDKMCEVVPEDMKIMAVVVGKNFTHAAIAFKELNIMEKIDIVCVPDRMLSRWTKMKRVEFMRLMSPYTQKPIHFLALDDWRDLPALARYGQSVDSTIPWKLAMLNIEIDKENFEDVKRPKNYFERVINKELALRNIKILKEVMQNEN
jgi:hypothetical protein